MSKAICFYHDPCRSCDGWAAAMGVWTYLKGDVELIGLNYNTEFDDRNYANKVVYIVDITPNDLSSIKAILIECKELHIFDHHDTAEKALNELRAWAINNLLNDKLNIIFDTGRSGARITWEALLHDSVPSVVYHVDDYDRWVFKYPDTKAVIAAIKLVNKDPRVWTNDVFNVTGRYLVNKGTAVLTYQDMVIKSILKYAREVTVQDTLTAVVNCPDEFVNEVLDALLDRYPFAIAYSDQVKQRKYSVRSAPSNTFTANGIAAYYGGGGHVTAAGFYTPLLSPIVGSPYEPDTEATI